MPFGGLVVNRVHSRRDRRRGAAPRSWSRSSARRWPSASPSRAARAGARWPPRRRERRAPRALELADPPTILVPELEDDVHDIEGLALDASPSVRLERGRLRRLLVAGQQAVGERRSAGSRWPQRTSRRTARRCGRAPRRAPRRRRRAYEAGDRGALERDRLAHAAPRAPVALLGRRSRRAARRRRVSPLRLEQREQRAAGQQPVGQRLPRRAALAAQLEAAQRPGQLARARRAARDQRAERAQRVLLVGASRQSPSGRRRPVASGTAIHGPPSVRAQAIGASEGSASSHRRSAVCRRRRRRPACSSAGDSPGRTRGARTATVA